MMGIGPDRGHTVNIIDFGFAKRFRDPMTCLHIRYRQDKNLTGTARYASINNHLGVEQSRQDDLESLAYILIYFLHGKLPWQGMRGTGMQRYGSILNLKQITWGEDLCRGYPGEFGIFLNYARNLHFEEEPDYMYLRNMFRDLSAHEGFEYDYGFDWKKEPDVQDDSNSPGSWVQNELDHYLRLRRVHAHQPRPRVPMLYNNLNT